MDPVRAAILDVGFFPAVAGTITHAKVAKDGKGGFDLGMRNAEFAILEKRGLKSDRALRIPQLRDEVWNSFHAKDGKGMLFIYL